jgi:hypothetical protein
MLPTQIEERLTDLAVTGCDNSLHAELLIGRLPGLETVSPEAVGPPLAHRVDRRLALAADRAPGHPPAQPVVAETA